MIFYPAGKFTERNRIKQLCYDLLPLGHKVNGRWLSSTHAQAVWSNREQAMAFAIMDLDDLQQADAVILFNQSEVPQSPGRNIEFGYALAHGKPVYLIGEQSGVFHYLPLVTHFHKWNDFISFIESWKVPLK
jgi:nucleoside 2-deoxyribosyltransferase